MLLSIPRDVLRQMIPLSGSFDIFFVCKHLNSFMQDEELWHRKLLQDFPKFVKEESDWKSIYKKLFLMKKEKKRLLSLTSPVAILRIQVQLQPLFTFLERMQY